MAVNAFKSISNRFGFGSQKHKNAGFTLIELLVGIGIASIVVTTLLSLTVQLLQTNQQESGRTQTQGDMKIALDYISSEMREAVYVYSGACIQGNGLTTDLVRYCPGVINHIGALPANSAPILAFWKLDELPDPLKTACTNTTTPPAGVPCVAGRTYTLVVYFLRKNATTDNPKWYGQSRITRYELTQYNSTTGAANSSYVNPDQAGITFRSWPYKNVSSAFVNQQTSSPPTANPDTLVDFVDDTPRTGDSTATCPTVPVGNPTKYLITPSTTTLPFSSSLRSFYGCVKVSNTPDEDGASVNQDVLLFLRGNPKGRVGINYDSYLPYIQTQVLRRGIVNREPPPLQ